MKFTLSITLFLLCLGIAEAFKEHSENQKPHKKHERKHKKEGALKNDLTAKKEFEKRLDDLRQDKKDEIELNHLRRLEILRKAIDHERKKKRLSLSTTPAEDLTGTTEVTLKAPAALYENLKSLFDIYEEEELDVTDHDEKKDKKEKNENQANVRLVVTNESYKQFEKFFKKYTFSQKSKKD